jgi:hypothetical protein
MQNESLETVSAPSKLALEPTKEAPLKYQSDVICKNSRSVQEGSLLLTNRRLIFVEGKGSLKDSELQSVLQENDHFTIPLPQVANVSGKQGFLRPSLTVAWHPTPEDPSSTKTDFLQKYRPQNLEDARNGINQWVAVIEQAATSDLDLAPLEMKNEEEQPTIDDSELRSRLLEELNDKQWKGFFQIERDLGEKFGLSVDPDALERCCKNLVAEKLVEQDKHGEFFRKIQASQK